MILLNPFNGVKTPIYEVHLTVQEDSTRLEMFKGFELGTELGIKLTPIKFFNINTPPQYMFTYIDTSEDVSEKMSHVCSKLSSYGFKIIRKKIETSWKWYEENLEAMKLNYFETHIELPIQCFKIIEATPDFLKSYNGNKPHLFSLTNRIYDQKDIANYYTGLALLLDSIHMKCWHIPTYQSLHSTDKTLIEVCILDTNPSLDNTWFTNLE